jgi:hypothetical protein
MHKPFFTGVCTALVTPFLNQEINYPMVEMLLRRQIEGDITNEEIFGMLRDVMPCGIEITGVTDFKTDPKYI